MKRSIKEIIEATQAELDYQSEDYVQKLLDTILLDLKYTNQLK